MSEAEEQQKPQQPPTQEGGESAPVIIPLERHREPETEDGPPRVVEGGELRREEIKAIIEALLFAASGPLSAGKLARLVGTRDGRLMHSILAELKQDYDTRQRAFAVAEIAGGYQLLTRPEFHPWVRKLREREQEETLSQAALETLAIVAYRQPITRAEIEDIRGVQSGYILRSLIEKSLVRVAGRSEELGRPLLYGTGSKFLDVFELASLRDLPKLDELEPPEDGK